MAKKVAQLREQKNQSLPPLKVFSNEELAGKYQSSPRIPQLNEASTEDYERFPSKLGMTVDEMLNEAYFPKAELAYKYAPGEHD
jgi:hypothetical protein